MRETQRLKHLSFKLRASGQALANGKSVEPMALGQVSIGVYSLQTSLNIIQASEDLSSLPHPCRGPRGPFRELPRHMCFIVCSCFARFASARVGAERKVILHKEGKRCFARACVSSGSLVYVRAHLPANTEPTFRGASANPSANLPQNPPAVVVFLLLF